MQIPPVPELSGYIKHYILLEHAAATEMTLRVFSDGNTGMVFALRQPLYRLTDSTGLIALPNSFIYGQISTFEDSLISHAVSLLIVVFQPAGISALLELHGDRIENQFIAIEEILGPAGKELEEKLVNAGSDSLKITLLNQFFTRLCCNRKIIQDDMIQASVQYINRCKGTVSVGQLERFSGYSERQLERRFLAAIGINPKRYISIIRLHSFLKQLERNPAGENLTRLAFAAGYTDQSHLIREFKKYTGMTPGTYAGKVNKLTTNFLRIK